VEKVVCNTRARTCLDDDSQRPATNTYYVPRNLSMVTHRMLVVILAGCLLFAPTLCAAPTFSHSGGGKRGYASADSKQAHALNYNVSLHFVVANASSDQLAAIQSAFNAAQISATLHEQGYKNAGTLVVIKFDRRADLRPIVQAVNAANHGSRSAVIPTVDLLVYAALTHETAKATIECLGKVSGVDVANSSADSKTGEVKVRLNGEQPLTPDDVQRALRDAGASGSFSKSHDVSHMSWVKKLGDSWRSWLPSKAKSTASHDSDPNTSDGHSSVTK